MSDRGEPIAVDKARMQMVLEHVEKLASGDLTSRLPISGARDSFDAISFGINLLADEVEFRYGSEARRKEELMATMAQLEKTLGELRETQAQLIQSAKMAALGEFSSGVAHEINNPLTLIRAYAVMIEELVVTPGAAQPPDAKKVASYLVKINANIDRMAHTVKHVQDFSRRADDQQNEPVRLNGVVISALEFARDQMKTRGIELSLDLMREPLMVSANPMTLEHVMLNLLSNACDAIESPQGGRITVVTEIEGGDAVVRVRDNGVGIAADAAQKIYQPFFTTKAPGEGTGLGLAISYRIVKGHGGRIDCVSAVGEGTTFSVYLPLLPASESKA